MGTSFPVVPILPLRPHINGLVDVVVSTPPWAVIFPTPTLLRLLYWLAFFNRLDLIILVLIPGLPGLYPIPLMLYCSLLNLYRLDNASLSVRWISELIFLLGIMNRLFRLNRKTLDVVRCLLRPEGRSRGVDQGAERCYNGRLADDITPRRHASGSTTNHYRGIKLDYTNHTVSAFCTEKRLKLTR